MEAIPTAQNNSRRPAATHKSTLRLANPIPVIRTAINARAVSATGASSNGSILRPLTSMSVAVKRTGSLAVPPEVTAVTDTPWYTGPKISHRAATQVKTWATPVEMTPASPRLTLKSLIGCPEGGREA